MIKSISVTGLCSKQDTQTYNQHFLPQVPTSFLPQFFLSVFINC